MRKPEEITKEAEELLSKMKELQKEYEQVTTSEVRWKPKKDETYYCLGSTGGIVEDVWCDDNTDLYRYSIGNVFETEVAAREHRDLLILRQEVEDEVKRINGDWEPEFGHETPAKYHVVYDYIKKELAITSFQWIRSSNYIFPSIENAQKLIDKFGDKLLKVLF